MFFKFSGSGNNFESAAGVLSSLDRTESTGARLIGVAGNKTHAPGRVQKHNTNLMQLFIYISLLKIFRPRQRLQSNDCSPLGARTRREQGQSVA